MIGVNAEGYRKILGIRIANSETEQGWLEIFRWLKPRGLQGVDLMVSDAHEEWTTGRRYFRMDDYFSWRAGRDGVSTFGAIVSHLWVRPTCS